MFINFVPIYLENEFVLAKQQIGFVLGGFGFFMAITHMPSGHLSDRIGRRPLLFAAWFMGLSSALIMGLAGSLPWYLVGVFGYGLTAFVSSPLSSYVTAARGAWSVSTALSLTSATFNIGMALGPVTGGWIADLYGMRTTYLVAAGVFLISTVFVMFIKGQPVDVHDPEMPPVRIWNNQRFVSFVMVLAFAVFAMYLAQPLTPNYLAGVRGLSLSETGWIFSAGAFGNAVLALVLSRFNPRRGFLFAELLVVLFAICIWKGAGVPVFMLGYFLLGGFRASRALAMAQARELVHDSQMGLTYGIMETVNAVIFILTPPLAGYIFERDSMIIYPISIILIALSIIVAFIFPPRNDSHA